MNTPNSSLQLLKFLSRDKKEDNKEDNLIITEDLPEMNERLKKFKTLLFKRFIDNQTIKSKLNFFFFSQKKN
jgi:hypothetical protein